MASVRLCAMDGRELGPIDLNDEIFSVEMNPSLVHDVAVGIMNAARQGNACTKVRSKVRGGGKKPFKQKGTGNARQGSSREPHMKGGGVVFGPHKRSYVGKVPVAFKRRAVCCLLSDRVRGNALSILDAVSLEEPKTRMMVEMLSKLVPNGKKTLIVTSSNEKNIVLAVRNLPKVTITTASDLNVVDLLDAVNVLVAQSALANLEERLL